MDDNQNFYFISAATAKEAVDIAKDKGIRPNCWRWVPLEKKERFATLSGYHGIPKENLIGDFDKEEITYLTIGAEKEKEEPAPPQKEKPNTNININISSDTGLAVADEKKKEEE